MTVQASAVLQQAAAPAAGRADGVVVGAAEPTSEEARRLLEQELSKVVYHQESVVDRILRWIQERLSDITAGPDPGATGLSPLATTLVLLALVAVAAYVAPRIQRERRVRSAREGVLAGVTKSTAQLRAAAQAALDRGDFRAAVLDGYRALARSSADRALLTDAPGLTAHEIGVHLAPHFPSQAQRLTGAAALFDEVKYGAAVPSRRTAQELLSLEDELRRTRPVLDLDPRATPVGGGP